MSEGFALGRHAEGLWAARRPSAIAALIVLLPGGAWLWAVSGSHEATCLVRTARGTPLAGESRDVPALLDLAAEADTGNPATQLWMLRERPGPLGAACGDALGALASGGRRSVGVSVEPVGTTELIAVRATAREPATALAAANGVAEAYVKQARDGILAARHTLLTRVEYGLGGRGSGTHAKDGEAPPEVAARERELLLQWAAAARALQQVGAVGQAVPRIVAPAALKPPGKRRLELAERLAGLIAGALGVALVVGLSVASGRVGDPSDLADTAAVEVVLWPVDGTGAGDSALLPVARWLHGATGAAPVTVAVLGCGVDPRSLGVADRLQACLEQHEAEGHEPAHPVPRIVPYGDMLQEAQQVDEACRGAQAALLVVRQWQTTSRAAREWVGLIGEGAEMPTAVLILSGQAQPR